MNIKEMIEILKTLPQDNGIYLNILDKKNNTLLLCEILDEDIVTDNENSYYIQCLTSINPDINELKLQCSNYHLDIETLQQENARLREGLERIADYNPKSICDLSLCSSRKSFNYIQKIATEALQQKGEE